MGQEIDLLDNIDQIEVIGKLTEEFESDLKRMEVVFANPNFLQTFWSYAITGKRILRHTPIKSGNV